MSATGFPGLAAARPDAVIFSEFPVRPPFGRPGPPIEKATVALSGRSRLVLFTPGLLQTFTGDPGRAVPNCRAC